MAEIIRPTLVVDKKVCEQNIERMAKKAAGLQIRFRPHFKTHQSAKIGEWFRQAGVEAITVSSLRMAEYFATNSWQDITIAFPVNILEIGNINRLASKIKLGITVENIEAAGFMAEKAKYPLAVWIKIDTGYNRTGINYSDTGLIDAVIHQIALGENLIFKGFLTHTGQTYTTNSSYEIHNIHFEVLQKLKGLKSRYSSMFPQIEISMGDTPSATICTDFSGVDELRPGNFVFYDVMQQSLGVCNFEDIAVRMVCPVVAKHALRNEIVIHGGAVHFSKDAVRNTDGKLMFGRIVIKQNGEKILLDTLNYLSKISQEHGILKVAQSQLQNFKVGDLVEIVPVHSCLTANLMGFYQTTDGEILEMMPRF